MKSIYKVFFEVYGKKMQTKVVAKDEHEARMKVLNEIKFHKVQFDSFQNKDDDFFDSIKDILNL